MRVSVVISTCNRPRLLKSAIESILSNTYPDFDLVIIDQSESNETKNLVNEYARYDNRIKYLWSEKGKSKALNLGIKDTKGEIITLTDDDCVVAQDWIEKIVVFFEKHPDASVGFGDVIPVKSSLSEVMCPWYQSENRKYIGIYSMVNIIGIGANMFIKRDVFDKVGLFDEYIGPGEAMPACEDYDFVYRILAIGCTMYDTNSVKVLHNGWRNLEEAMRLIRDYRQGLGAFFIKHLRCGDFRALLALIGVAWKTTYFTLFRGLTKPANRTPIHLPNSLSDRLLFFIIWLCHPFIDIVSGIFKAFQFSVDKNKKVFIKK